MHTEYDKTRHIAASAGLVEESINTGGFHLLAFTRLGSPKQPLTVYIEGDGGSWVSRHQVARDPTPSNPLALQLAALDSSNNVAWLARPCQYASLQLDALCSDSVLGQNLWTGMRYSQVVVTALDNAIEQLRQRSGANSINLVGYSGGATIALLIAAHRQDVASIRTVAGNLDTEAFTTHHQVTPLPIAVNPLLQADKLAIIPQIHWFGQNDTTIPPPLAEAYVKAANKNNCVLIQTVANATHSAGWLTHWKEFLDTPLPCKTH